MPLAARRHAVARWPGAGCGAGPAGVGASIANRASAIYVNVATGRRWARVGQRRRRRWCRSCRCGRCLAAGCWRWAGGGNAGTPV